VYETPVSGANIQTELAKKPAEIYLCAIGPVAEENGMRMGIIGAGKVGGGLGKIMG
jgi:hypothetical protein